MQGGAQDGNLVLWRWPVGRCLGFVHQKPPLCSRRLAARHQPSHEAFIRVPEWRARRAVFLARLQDALPNPASRIILRPAALMRSMRGLYKFSATVEVDGLLAAEAELMCTVKAVP